MAEPLEPDVQMAVVRTEHGLHYDAAALLATCDTAVAAVAAEPEHRIVVQVTLRPGLDADGLAGFVALLMQVPEVASIGMALAEPVDETVTQMRPVRVRRHRDIALHGERSACACGGPWPCPHEGKVIDGG